MCKFATKVLFAAWCGWLAVHICVVVSQRFGTAASVLVWAVTLGGVMMIAGGCVLSGLLIRFPNRGLSVVLAVLSGSLLWKFYVGEIVFSMHPELGGYTFSQAVAAWVSRHTVSVSRFLLWFAPMILLGASLVFYPIYCIIHRDNRNHAPG